MAKATRYQWLVICSLAVPAFAAAVVITFLSGKDAVVENSPIKPLKIVEAGKVDREKIYGKFSCPLSGYLGNDDYFPLLRKVGDGDVLKGILRFLTEDLSSISEKHPQSLRWSDARKIHEKIYPVIGSERARGTHDDRVYVSRTEDGEICGLYLLYYRKETEKKRMAAHFGYGEVGDQLVFEGSWFNKEFLLEHRPSERWIEHPKDFGSMTISELEEYIDEELLHDEFDKMPEEYRGDFYPQYRLFARGLTDSGVRFSRRQLEARVDRFEEQGASKEFCDACYELIEKYRPKDSRNVQKSRNEENMARENMDTQ